MMLLEYALHRLLLRKDLDGCPTFQKVSLGSLIQSRVVLNNAYLPNSFETGVLENSWVTSSIQLTVATPLTCATTSHAEASSTYSI